MNSLNANWTTARNYKMKVQNPISMIDGINKDIHNFRVDVYANQYVKIIYGSTEHVFPINSKLLDSNWYGVVVNIGNTWGQLNVHIWQPTNSDFGDKLSSFFTKTISFIPEGITVDSYSLNKSDGYVTNIRLFKTTIEDENQTLELLAYLSKDADQALILDNADERFSNPYISRQR
jgi:hypothetical protein